MAELTLTDVKQDTIRSEVPAYIELFEIDLTSFGGQIHYLTTMTTSNYQKVNFGNQLYDPFPIAISGIEENIEGAPPRPTLIVSNVNKLFAAAVFAQGDILGAKVTYIRTFERYLNLASRLSMPVMKFTIGKKEQHNEEVIGFSLRLPTDRERLYMPKWQMLRSQFPGLGINKHVG